MEETAITLTESKELSEIFFKSGLFKDIKDKNQAIVKVIAGREIGLQPFESMSGLDIINGKVTISGKVMASKIKQSKKYTYRVTKMTNEECSIDFYEGEEVIGTSTFTMEDAERITFWDSKSGRNKKLTEKDNWRHYPRNMLFNRALSNGQRWYCPDVFGSVPVYVPEEMGVDVDGDGEPINITPPKAKETPSEDIIIGVDLAKEGTKCKTVAHPEKVIEANIAKAQTIEHKPDTPKPSETRADCPTCGQPKEPVKEGHEMAGRLRCVNEKCQYGFPDCPMPNCNGVMRDTFKCIDGEGVCCDTCHAVFKEPKGFGNYDGDSDVCQECIVHDRCDGNPSGAVGFIYDGRNLTTPEALKEKHTYTAQLNELEELVDDDDETILIRIKEEVGYKKTRITHDERNEKAREVLEKFMEAT